MGSPTGGGPPAVTTSIIPNPSASAAANNTIGKGIVAAGLSDASLKKLYASIPESQHSTVKVLNVNDDEPTGYVECYPVSNLATQPGLFPLLPLPYLPLESRPVID